MAERLVTGSLPQLVAEIGLRCGIRATSDWQLTEPYEVEPKPAVPPTAAKSAKRTLRRIAIEAFCELQISSYSLKTFDRTEGWRSGLSPDAFYDSKSHLQFERRTRDSHIADPWGRFGDWIGAFGLSRSLTRVGWAICPPSSDALHPIVTQEPLRTR